MTEKNRLMSSLFDQIMIVKQKIKMPGSSKIRENTS